MQNEAKLLIENQYERKLDRAKPAGAIFAVKNMGKVQKRFAVTSTPMNGHRCER